MFTKRVPIFGYDLGMSTWSFHKEMERRLPFAKILERTKQLEREFPGLEDISIFIGLPQPNLPDSVLSVLTVGDSDDVVEKSAGIIAREIWDSRFDFFSARQLVPLDSALERAIRAKSGPVILVDVGDNTGGGSSGDSTFILEALLQKDVGNAVVPLRDPYAVQEAFAAGVGASMDLRVGGKIDGRFSRSVKIRGKVKLLSDGNYQIRGPCDAGYGKIGSKFDPWLEGNAGRLAVIKVGGLEVILTEGKAGKERDFYKSAGIDPSERKIVVVKSLEAHRASFESLASEIIEVDTPGITSLRFAKSFFENSPVQMFPFSPRDPELAQSPNPSTS